MSVFICPVCGRGLERVPGGYACAGGHRFDCAREGYVNLLPGGRAHAGDSAEMIAARTGFLNGGYYAPLREALTGLALPVLRRAPRSPLLVDAGCGEGYYAAGAAEALRQSGLEARVSGVDLSRRGVRAAAKRAPSAAFAVASIFALPYASGGADVVYSVFAPVCAQEFHRILRAEGRLLVVTPGRSHLLGLKRALYDDPYENDEPLVEPEGFEAEEERRLEYEIAVEGEDVRRLFAMTPYYWKTPPAFAARLQGVERLETPVSFIVTVLKKREKTAPGGGARNPGPEPEREAQRTEEASGDGKHTG